MSDTARQPINVLAALIALWIGVYWVRTPPAAVHAETWAAQRPEEEALSGSGDAFEWSPPGPLSSSRDTDNLMEPRDSEPLLPHQRDTSETHASDAGTQIPPDQPELSPPAPVRTWTVRRGDTLGAIAQREYGSIVYADFIFDANRDILRSPDDLDIGMVLRLPDKPED